jgi:CIC family chloride channel protein
MQDSPSKPEKRLWASFLPDETPLDLQILGRTLLHAAAIGAAAGLIGAIFFAMLEFLQRLLLERLCGYVILRAHGETFLGAEPAHPFRPLLLVFVPAAGALLGGLVTRLAPETRGGGGNQMIHAFHYQGGKVRRRVIGVKALASVLTLASGGAGGREGPTMQIGAALGSTVARYLRIGAREQRVLMVAGVAAGLSAVFRTPLGAALLAVEVLYRDDFEAEALIPAVLASVVSYSVVISAFGESTLFARASSYPFYAAHLPLYGLLAVGVAALAAGFEGTLRAVQRWSDRLPMPAWARPGVGGLLLGALAVPAVLYFGSRTGLHGQGLGLIGGGYGAAQLAITGMRWLPGGWAGVSLLLLLCVAKLIASSLTIGTGGSAGDFAPSLVLGAIFGGAFGRMAQLLLSDPRIDPGAFALVGMGTFYGGIAHVPVSSLIMVSELAGSYDLLVPLMLAEGIAFVALRRRTLYPAQVPTKHESPVHRVALLPERLSRVRVADVMVCPPGYPCFSPSATGSEIVARIAQAPWFDAVPVVDESNLLVGLLPAETLRLLLSTGEVLPYVVAAELMRPAVSVSADDNLRSAVRTMLAAGLPVVPVVGGDGRIVGFLDQANALKVHLEDLPEPTAATN